METFMTYVAGALLLLLSVQTFVVWKLSRAVSAIPNHSDELARLERALQLLTEANEAGFASYARAISSTLRPRRVVQARPAPAVERPARREREAPVSAPVAAVTAPSRVAFHTRTGTGFSWSGTSARGES